MMRQKKFNKYLTISQIKKVEKVVFRDIIEQILRVQGKWDSNFDATFD